MDNSPLDVTPKPGETLTEAVQEFRKTGQNSVQRQSRRRSPKARSSMRPTARCAICPTGPAAWGASLIGDKHVHERITNDVGLFEVIFGGASGAMQPFRKRMTQDEILKVMAYLRTLMKS